MSTRGALNLRGSSQFSVVYGVSPPYPPSPHLTAICSANTKQLIHRLWDMTTRLQVILSLSSTAGHIDSVFSGILISVISVFFINKVTF